MTRETDNFAFAEYVQRRLTTSGDYTGRIDGWAGPATRRAFDAAMDRAGAAQVAASPKIEPKKAIYHGPQRRLVDEIVVHCAATRPTYMAGASIEEKRAEIDRWHRERGWSGIGYHWLIDRDGAVIAGRPETQVGAHVQGHNIGTIGICLWGGHGAASTDRFLDHFTPDQDRALRRLIIEISQRTPIRRVSGHNEYAAKACPGFNVSTWLKEG